MFVFNRNNTDSLQPRLKIGRPDDEYEREADRVADAVMRMPAPRPQMQPMEEEEEEKVQMKPELGSPIQMKPEVPQIQQMCPRCRERARRGQPLDCPECEQKLQMSPAIQKKGDGATRATPQISNQLQASKGQGPPLPTEVQREMGRKMGTDFSGVNIHTDSKSHQLNRQLGAKAFTHGKDIYFNKGEYNPDSQSGKRLLAHELVHVSQQSGSIWGLIQRACEIGGGNNKQKQDWTPDLHRGNKGPMVRKLQKLLYDDGIDIGKDGSDGIYGRDTESAVKVFQKKYSLNVDGVVGRDTWDKLHAKVGMFFTVEEVNKFQASDSGTSETMTFTVAEAQAPPPLPGGFCAPLKSARNKGVYYTGIGSKDYMRTELKVYAKKLRTQNYPALAQGAMLFIKLAPLEGWMSAINTYDNKVLTWGSGFAHNGSLDTVWKHLDSSVQQFLVQHAPAYFSGGNISMGKNKEIRKDADALSALVYVAEHKPYRKYVLNAMLEVFFEDTLGISEKPKKGEKLPGGSFNRARALAVRLKHWLPAFMQIKADLTAVEKKYDNDKKDHKEERQVRASEVKAATELMVRFGKRFLKSDKGRDRKAGVSGGRIQAKVGYRVIVKFQRAFKRYFGSFEVPNDATHNFPGFTNGSEPYFKFYNSEQEIDQNNDVLVHHVKGKKNRYVDLGNHK